MRHLVVDMQATSNEKYIIAKLSRELQQCNFSLTDLILKLKLKFLQSNFSPGIA